MTDSQPQSAPSSYYPPLPLPHSHDKYVAIIIALGILVLLIGTGLAVTFSSTVQLRSQNSQLSAQNEQLSTQNEQLQQDLRQAQSRVSALQTQVRSFTWLYGTVDFGSDVTGKSILFDAQGEGTLSSSVFGDNSYQLYIPSGKTYTVTIYYIDAYGIEQCPTARPSLITPTGSSDIEDFLC